MSSKILFVCTGNTCRSPMAEGLLKKAISQQKNLQCLGSAGVSAYPGDAINPETTKILKKHNAELTKFSSRVVSDYLLDEVTHVLAMTRSHLNILNQTHPKHKDKFHLICDFVEIDGQVGTDLPDPIGQGPQAYEYVSEVIQHCIPGIIESLNTPT